MTYIAHTLAESEIGFLETKTAKIKTSCQSSCAFAFACTDISNCRASSLTSCSLRALSTFQHNLAESIHQNDIISKLCLHILLFRMGGQNISCLRLWGLSIFYISWGTTAEHFASLMRLRASSAQFRDPAVCSSERGAFWAPWQSKHWVFESWTILSVTKYTLGHIFPWLQWGYRRKV